MQVFTIPSHYRILTEVGTTAGINKPKSILTRVYELLDENTGDTFYFKHGVLENHMFTFEGEQNTVSLHIAKELLAMTFAREVGVYTCDFWFAYSPILKHFGILTRKHYSNPVPILNMTKQVEKIAGPLNSMPYQIAFAERLELIPTEEMFVMLKMQMCDIITFNADRHENNILFTDEKMVRFYPYFDCDYAINIPKGADHKHLDLKLLIAYNMKEFRILNFLYCLSRVLEDKVKDSHDNEKYLLKIPDITLLKDEIEALGLADYFPNLSNFLYSKVIDMNNFILYLLSLDWETCMQMLVDQYVPQQEVQSF